MPEELKSGQVKVSFERAAEFRTIQVDGAWGAVTPNSEIISVNFYHDYTGLPSSVVVTVEGGRRVGEESTGGGGTVRVVEAEVRMTPSVARSIARWLVERADEAERFLHAAAEGRAAEDTSSEDPAGGA